MVAKPFDSGKRFWGLTWSRSQRLKVCNACRQRGWAREKKTIKVKNKTN
jgi:hypothetical protein